MNIIVIRWEVLLINQQWYYSDMNGSGGGWAVLFWDDWLYEERVLCQNDGSQDYMSTPPPSRVQRTIMPSKNTV